jgi:hypothetical protein
MELARITAADLPALNLCSKLSTSPDSLPQIIKLSSNFAADY